MFTTYPLSQYTDDLARDNKIFKVMYKNLGKLIDVAYLNKLFSDIMNKNAMADSVFKTPSDVRKHNLSRLIAAIRGKNTKG